MAYNSSKRVATAAAAASGAGGVVNGENQYQYGENVMTQRIKMAAWRKPQ